MTKFITIERCRVDSIRLFMFYITYCDSFWLWIPEFMFLIFFTFFRLDIIYPQIRTREIEGRIHVFQTESDGE